LLSLKTDPLDDNSVAEVLKLIERRPAEIDALIRKCLSLAQDLSGETNLETLQRNTSVQTLMGKFNRCYLSTKPQ
jgi:hypothetical protein